MFRWIIHHFEEKKLILKRKTDSWVHAHTHTYTHRRTLTTTHTTNPQLSIMFFSCTKQKINQKKKKGGKMDKEVEHF